MIGDEWRTIKCEQVDIGARHRDTELFERLRMAACWGCLPFFLNLLPFHFL
jgi:hypothetical protein